MTGRSRIANNRPFRRRACLKTAVFGAVLWLIGLCVSLPLAAQEDAEMAQWMNLDIEALGKVRLISVSVGKKNLSIRESPGILSLITASEIADSGARDLMDVLRLVPGFDFAVDVESAVGLGVRGNWVHEGKALILLDGQEMNELLYATFPYGAHIPVEHIDRVEIIRGPGSSLFGGFAELAVINIVTKTNPGAARWEVGAVYGQMSQAPARTGVNLMTEQKLGPASLNIGLHAGRAIRSQNDYTDIYGYGYNLENNSRINSLYLNMALNYDKLSARFILDQYDYLTRDAFDAAVELPMKYCFHSTCMEAKYELQIFKTLKLTPRLNYAFQRPWNSTDENSIIQENYYKVGVERVKLSLNLSGDISRHLFINGGLIQYFDRGVVLGDTPESGWFSGEKEVTYSGAAAFIQTFVKTPAVIITAGLRYDRHNLYGDSLTPWVGLNKVYNKLYFKFLFGQTFRAPSIANISLGRNIRPEKSNEFDLETGYQLTPRMILSLNFFSTGLKDAIVYNVDPETEAEYYENRGRTGTWGIELEYLLKGEWGWLNAAYSFYRAKKEKLESFTVPGRPEMMLGFPTHKFTVSSSFNLTGGISVNPSLIYYSRRYGYETVDEEGTPLLTSFKPVWLVNVWIRFKNVAPRLDAGFGVYDALDQDYRFIQPYNGGHAPFPSTSRELVMRLTYRLD